MTRTIDDLIEIIRAVDNSPSSKCGFDMYRDASWRPCVACCIGGHAALALGNNELTAEYAVEGFGVKEDASEDICYPPEGHPGWGAKPHHAIALLEHYRDTGIVDWDRAMTAEVAE